MPKVTDPRLLQQLNAGQVVNPNPKFRGEMQGQQLDLTGKGLSNTRTQQEISFDNATAAARARQTQAQAQSAVISARQAQEQWDLAHPQNNPNTNGLYGDAYLKTLPPNDQNFVKALANYRLAIPERYISNYTQGKGVGDPFWKTKIDQLLQFDPAFDMQGYKQKLGARMNATTGFLSKSNNALNTALGHLQTLSDQIDGTASHGGFPLATTVNAVENWYSRQHGDAGITNFTDTASKLADELEAVYRNGGGAEAGVVRQLRNLDPNMSRDQKVGIVHNAMDLLASKMAANLSQYDFGVGGKPDWSMLDPHAREIFEKNAPDIRDKYFAGAGGGANGGGGGSDAPPPISGGGGRADYSGMVGGPQASLAVADPNSPAGAFKQTYRNEYDPVMAGTISAFIRKGAPYETVAAFAQSHGFNPPDPHDYAAGVAFAKAHGGATNVEANRSVPTTLGERLASSPAAAFLSGAASGGTAGLSDVLGRSLAGPQYDANRAALGATNPTADILGNTAGGAGAMFAGGGLLGDALTSGAKGGVGRNLAALALKNPVKAATLGDAAYGGVYGATQNPDNPLAGAGAGAVIGGLASPIGAGLTKGAAGVLNGITTPAVQRLRAAGIPLTVGEVIGGGAKRAQDALTSIYGPGNMVARRYADGRQALNQVAFNQAGQTIGAPINDVGQAGIRALDAAKSQAYSNALDPVSLNLNNPGTIGGIGTALNQGRAIPNVDQASDIATGGLENYIGNAAPGGMMSGRDFQQAYRGLSRLGRQSKDRVYGNEIGNVLGQGQDALVGALQAQNPGAFDAFLKANSANRHLSVLTDAVNAAKNQVGDNGEPLFTPAQLGTAATGNARTYSGKVAAASGERPFNQLATDAQQVMSSKLPESGTFPRALLAAGLLGGGGGIIGGHQDGGQGAAEGALLPLLTLSLLGTRRGQKFLTSSLVDRTPADQYTGALLRRNPTTLGDLLTASGLPLLATP